MSEVMGAGLRMSVAVIFMLSHSDQAETGPVGWEGREPGLRVREWQSLAWGRAWWLRPKARLETRT